MNQAKYCETLQEIKVANKRDTTRPLNKEEYKDFQGAIGKLNWLQGQTRPDLSYDNLNMSMKSKDTTVHDVNEMNKIIRKAKEGSNTSKMTYRKLRNYESLKVIGFSDAGYKTVDDKVRLVEGRMLFLTKRHALSCDDAIYFARIIREIYTCEKSHKQTTI